LQLHYRAAPVQPGPPAARGSAIGRVFALRVAL